MLKVELTEHSHVEQQDLWLKALCWRVGGHWLSIVFMHTEQKMEGIIQRVRGKRDGNITVILVSNREKNRKKGAEKES